MRLSELLGQSSAWEMWTEYLAEDREADLEITGLSADSREVKRGDLFFCLTGGKLDGHDYVQEAIKNGAAAIVCERALPVSVPQIVVENSRKALALMSAAFFNYPSKSVKVIGITGTNGKTTTAYMLRAILEKAGKKTGLIGTLGVFYDGQTEEATLTTPDPIALQATLARMRDSGVEYAVMEVSAHALYYDKIAGVEFVACIFTNLSQDHLDFFPSMREYKAAKSRLFSYTVAPIAILNGDEEAGREFAALREIEGGRTLFYGLDTPSDAFAILTDENLHGAECLMNVNDKLCRVSLSLTGRHNVYNALAAAACAVELGVDVSAVAAGLTTLKGVAGRLERVATYQGAEIFVDFAHTPDGLEKSLSSLRSHCKGRLVCLFGCGGNRDKKKRPLMGETVAKVCDFAVLSSDNPRYEDPLDIIGEIERGYRRFSMCYVIVPERANAISYALDFLGKGDVLLVAGKGGERYQEIMGIKYPFDDNAIIKKTIEEKEQKQLG